VVHITECSDGSRSSGKHGNLTLSDGTEKANVLHHWDSPGLRMCDRRVLDGTRQNGVLVQPAELIIIAVRTGYRFDGQPDAHPQKDCGWTHQCPQGFPVFETALH